MLRCKTLPGKIKKQVTTSNIFLMGNAPGEFTPICICISQGIFQHTQWWGNCPTRPYDFSHHWRAKCYFYPKCPFKRTIQRYNKDTRIFVSVSWSISQSAAPVYKPNTISGGEGGPFWKMPHHSKIVKKCPDDTTACPFEVWGPNYTTGDGMKPRDKTQLAQAGASPL